jgi:hypothetical protein
MIPKKILPNLNHLTVTIFLVNKHHKTDFFGDVLPFDKEQREQRGQTKGSGNANATL